MVTFRCKASGNCVSFYNDVDIESMRKEPHYEEVKEITNAVQEERQETSEEVKPVRKAGRPKKTVV